MLRQACASAIVVVLFASTAANATGLLYRRSGNVGRWEAIYTSGDLRASGAFTGRTFAAPTSTAKAVSVQAACSGTQRYAVFAAKVSGSAPNTGIFIYDETAGTITDAVVEGATTPITGFWDSFSGASVAATVDTTACVLHIVFRSHVTGLTPTTDTGIFDATYTIPALTPLGTTAIVQEGVTAAPLPFVGAVFTDFPVGLATPALYTTGAAAVGYAFRGKVTGPGITSSNDSGIFVYSGGLNTVAREGDMAACPPTWPGHGPQYDEFPGNLQVTIGYTTNFGAVYRAKSIGVGNVPGSDTALERGLAGALCGAATEIAVEGQPTSIGGVYGDFGPTTGVAYTANTNPKAAFVSSILALSGISKAVFFSDLTTATAIVRNGQADTALGATKVTIPSDANPAVEDSGNVIFKVSLSGYSTALLQYSNSINPPQVVTFSGRLPQIDSSNNITAHFP